jgi:hypothetical protein
MTQGPRGKGFTIDDEKRVVLTATFSGCMCLQIQGLKWHRPRGGPVMAKIIEFYIPSNFRRNKNTVNQKRGQVIEFVQRSKKSA